MDWYLYWDRKTGNVKNPGLLYMDGQIIGQIGLPIEEPQVENSKNFLYNIDEKKMEDKDRFRWF